MKESSFRELVTINNHLSIPSPFFRQSMARGEVALQLLSVLKFATAFSLASKELETNSTRYC